MSGYVYAIASSDGLVKIGFTTNLFARLSQLQTSSPQRLTPLGAIKAVYDQETTLHQLLADENEKGEWFRRGPLTEYFLSKLPAWPKRQRKALIANGADPISKARESIGLSQTEMAKKLGVNQSTVWRWEKGQMPISPVVKRAVEQLIAEKDRAA